MIKNKILERIQAGEKALGVSMIDPSELMVAEALVQYTYFAPIGVRSSTSIRTVMALEEGGRSELYEQINANTMLVPQLEQIGALENVEDILSVDGIDYFTPGFEDQAQAMGLAGQADSAAVQDA